MADTTTATPDIMGQLQQLMSQYTAQPHASIPHASLPQQATGWGQPAPFAPAGALPQFRAVNVPLRVPLPDGSEIRLYAELPGEVLASQQTLLAALQALMQQGLPLDVWAPKGDWGNRDGWGNRSGGGRSGWSRRRW
jgi:hypothetical protein